MIFFLVLYVTVLYTHISKASVRETKPVEGIYCEELAYVVVRFARYVWHPQGLLIRKAGWNSWACTEVKIPQNFFFRETPVLLLRPILIESGLPDELPYNHSVWTLNILSRALTTTHRAVFSWLTGQPKPIQVDTSNRPSQHLCTRPCSKDFIKLTHLLASQQPNEETEAQE